MTYQAVVKELPACVVFSQERRLERYSQVSELIADSMGACARLNPGLEPARPGYSFCEYPDGEYRERDMLARYSQAVAREGVGDGTLQFRRLEATKAICIYHKGAYERLGEAYAYLTRYAEENGYTPAGPARECYIDGPWNKAEPEQYLTEIQLPILEVRFCQSCGMPLADEVRGTEADGRPSADYCKYCYQAGKFTAEMTMEQMIDFCAQPMAAAHPEMTPEQAKAQMEQFFPLLKRWKGQ